MKHEKNNWIIGIVDKKYKHPGAGRYTKFAQYMNIEFMSSPVNFRFFKRKWLNKLEYYIFVRFSRGPSEHLNPYSFGLLVQEIWALLKMKRSSGSVFHAVKGENDMHHLPRWSRGTDARLIITFHDALDYFRHVSVDEKFLQNVDGVVALCESQRKYFTSRMPPERVRVVHHGVDTVFFRPSFSQRKGNTVISVGSYCRDHKVFSEAIPKVWELRPDVRFILLGLATMPQSLPKRINDARISYVDDVSDATLLSLYHQADLAAISLWAATANNALLEAMSCGLPVVATDIGGIREYAGEGTGIYTPPQDSDQFASAIVRILDNPDEALSMGLTARDRAENLFDYKVTARAMQEFYDHICSMPQAPGDKNR